MRNLLGIILGLPRNAILKAIDAYQASLSPDHGPLRHLYPYGYCRHSPTCSQYAKQAVQSRGAIVGLAMAMARILTCVPWKKPSERKIREAIEATSALQSGE